MLRVFDEVAANIASPTVREWKQQGGRIVGYTCAYVPAELLHAADILPVRLRGIGTRQLTIGDAFFGPYICSFPKALLQLAGEEGYAFLDGAIITPGCDSMRRLDECWRKAGEDHRDKNIVPPFFYYFDVPHKTEAHGMAWFEDEIRKLIASVEARFEVQITPDKLRRSIRIYNQGRRLLAQMAALRRQHPPALSGARAFTVSLGASLMPREAFNRHLASALTALDDHTTAPAADDRKRLMLLGSISDDRDLIDLIEADGAAVVVCENLCFGSRFGAPEVCEEGDPITALAETYLGASTCPRMFGRYAERLAAIVDAVTRWAVDGVVLQNIRFCDMHGSENSLIEHELEGLGIACLKIEREYGPLVETGRIKMRLDAFMERIAERSSCDPN